MKLMMTPLHAAHIQLSYQVEGKGGRELLDRFPQYSRSLVYEWARRPMNAPLLNDKRKFNPGRPRKMTVKDQRVMIRSLKSLREKEGHFTSKRLQVNSGAVAERLRHRSHEQNVPSSTSRLDISVEVTSQC